MIPGNYLIINRKWVPFEVVIFLFVLGDQVSWEVRSLSSLRSLVDSHDSRGQLKTVPRMTQPHFITLWKTLYELFQAKPHDQEVIHSIATIGNC